MQKERADETNETELQHAASDGERQAYVTTGSSKSSQPAQGNTLDWGLVREEEMMRWTYDNVGRVASMTAHNQTLTYTYDAVGQRIKMEDAQNVESEYRYDAAGRMTQVNQPVTTFIYDADGRTLAQKNQNGTRSSFTYDAAGQTLEIFHQKSDGAVFSSMTYTYDPVGNRTSLVELDASRTTWSYDNTYQLTRAQRNGPATTVTYDTTYTYDPVGNRLVMNEDGTRTTYTYNDPNQIQTALDSAGTTTFTFDADGNQLTEHKPNGDRTTNTWDYENRLTQVQLSGGHTEDYKYRPDNLRVEKDATDSDPILFLWDFQNLYAEYDNIGVPFEKYWYKPQVYGELLAQGIPAFTTYHFDALGSTIALTDASANVTDEWVYSPYGTDLRRFGTTAAIEFRFVGRFGYSMNTMTRRFYMRERYYSSTLGRWISQDPMFLVLNDDPNLFRYAHNRPTTFIDPSGFDVEYPIPARTCPACFPAYGVCNFNAGARFAGCVSGALAGPLVAELGCLALCAKVPGIGSAVCYGACTIGNLGVLACFWGYICPDLLDEWTQECINEYNRCVESDPTCKGFPIIRPRSVN